MYVSKDITWRAAVLDTVQAKAHGKGHACTLCAWGHACLVDPLFIPPTSWTEPRPLIWHDEFQEELLVYLQEVGKYVTAAAVVQFTLQSDMQKTWGLTKAVSRTTAQRWMRALNYWACQDVVECWQNVYLKRWKAMESQMESYVVFEIYTHMDCIICQVIVWYHDECMFNANDWHIVLWVMLSASIKPSKKGEGESLMVSKIVSAEHGWMCSPDGIIRPCKDHVFVFDNSPTHLKRGSDAPSAQRMPKFTPKPGAKNFLVHMSDKDGNKIAVPMTGVYFSNGLPQSLYWPEGHPWARWFKGTVEILKERGWENAEKITAKYPTSILEHLVTLHGHGFLLLPKFHPELNPIEQCWGMAKQEYQVFPDSVGEARLQQNVEDALEKVTLEDIQRFCTCSQRICDGYMKGLDGQLSVWAAKRYHRHCQYPKKILEEAEDAIGKSGNGF
ncbi:hypothetical protein BDV93DRAFT_534888 [Ceratobasidium sp. AG-I]|nr:hypothetical protein BDV93DRAFT_534888 [Ceratobasidium sp. AG-I]